MLKVIPYLLSLIHLVHYAYAQTTTAIPIPHAFFEGLVSGENFVASVVNVSGVTTVYEVVDFIGTTPEFVFSLAVDPSTIIEFEANPTMESAFECVIDESENSIVCDAMFQSIDASGQTHSTEVGGQAPLTSFPVVILPPTQSPAPLKSNAPTPAPTPSSTPKPTAAPAPPASSPKPPSSSPKPTFTTVRTSAGASPSPDPAPINVLSSVSNAASAQSASPGSSTGGGSNSGSSNDGNFGISGGPNSNSNNGESNSGGSSAGSDSINSGSSGSTDSAPQPANPAESVDSSTTTSNSPASPAPSPSSSSSSPSSSSSSNDAEALSPSDSAASTNSNGAQSPNGPILAQKKNFAIGKTLSTRDVFGLASSVVLTISVNFFFF